MTDLVLSVAEPFTSPAWGSNFAVFSSEDGAPVAEENTKDYIGRACRYAKSFSVYLVPERFLLQGRQCMCLISPQGKVLGAQQGLFWNTHSPYLGGRGSSIEVTSTEFGGIFLCVDVDVYRPEVTRLAADLGAQILICSQQIQDGDYSSRMVVNGVWNTAQTNLQYAVGACNKYHCVCAPRLLTENGDGFLVSPNLKVPMTARFHAERLLTVPRPPRLNRKFYAVHREDLMQS